jgi:hypothetical protein
MTSVPVFAVLLVVLEFVALFVATWIAWFAVLTVYQILTRKPKSATTSGIRSASSEGQLRT